MFTKRLSDYIGDISQIGGIKRYTFTSGKAKGVEAVDVKNGFDEAYYTITEISQMLRLSRAKTYEMSREGSFPVVQIGRVLRIPASKFQLWLNSNM